MKELKQKTGRRNFLRGAVGVGGGLVALAAGCKPEPKAPAAGVSEPVSEPAAEPVPKQQSQALPDGLDPENFVLHGRSPLTLETKRSALGMGVITPVSRFFVRNNLPMPDRAIVEDADAWKLEIEGVGAPQTLTLAELKRMIPETITTIIQCSGNGRKFSKHGPSGSQWATGAAGCAMWTGVRVSALVDKLGGAKQGAKFLTSTGGEELPAGVDPLTVMVERSVPIEKGLDDCMLVWEMNGAPIPLTHGGPLRLIVPGYYGCNQIKYVRKLALTAEETTAKIQKSGYRFRAIGEKGNPSHDSMWRMNVKSWINGPGAGDEPSLQGSIQFYGVAFSGERGVRSVEYSLDGKTWQSASLFGPDLGKNAWRTFVFEATLQPGTHTLFTRATDTEGEVQPESRAENERGYGNNSWRDNALTVTCVAELPKRQRKKATAADQTAPTRAAGTAELSGDGRLGRKVVLEEVQPACGTCHTIGDAGTTGAIGPNLDTLKPTEEMVEAAVANGVGAMPPYRDLLSDTKIKQVAKYVFEATK